MREVKNLTIRKAQIADAPLLVSWGNDGAIMAHAGFPKGVGVAVNEVIELIKKNSDTRCQFILNIDDLPIGEMHYRKKENTYAEIGIKICNKVYQNNGFGKKFLSLLINDLFCTHKCKAIFVNVSNKNKIAQHVYKQLGFKFKKIFNQDSKNPASQYELTVNNFINYSPNLLHLKNKISRKKLNHI